MALDAIKGWYILQAGFISAYLAGDLRETIYMEQFQGLQDFFEERPNMAQQYHYKADSIIELKRPFYGLKQSARVGRRR